MSMASPAFGHVWDLRYRVESVDGIPAKLLKSAIQKFVRRGELGLGMECIGLLDTCIVHEARGGKLSTSAKSLRTNVMNRMVAMMSEEV